MSRRCLSVPPFTCIRESRSSHVLPASAHTVLKSLDSISASRPFVIKINGLERCRIEQHPGIQELSRRFADISRYCSVRTGDMLAFELAPEVPVGREEHLTATFGTGGSISIIVR